MKRTGLFFILTILIFSVFLCGAAAPGMLASESTDAKSEYNVPIVMYHSTHRKNAGKYTVTPAQLERDLMWAKKNGFTSITISDLIKYQEKGLPLPEKPIMFTFDDGYVNNYINAYPLFCKYKMKCVMSVVGCLTDANYTGDTPTGKGSTYVETSAHLSYEQIKEMHDSGYVEIQNHTYNLHKIGKRYGLKKKKGEDSAVYKAFVKDDLLKLHEKILEHTGITCTAVAFPFGGYSKEAMEVLKEIGYKAALTCTEGMNKVTRTSNLFLLKRYNRPTGKSSAQFFGNICKNS